MLEGLGQDDAAWEAYECEQNATRRRVYDLKARRARHPAPDRRGQGPPAWYEDAGVASIRTEEDVLSGDPLAQPAPDYEFARRVAW